MIINVWEQQINADHKLRLELVNAFGITSAVIPYDELITKFIDFSQPELHANIETCKWLVYSDIL